MLPAARPASAGGAVSGPILAADGGVSAPSYSFATDTNTGFYHTGSSNIDVAIGGARNFNFASNNFNIRTDNGTLTFGASLDTSIGRGGAAGKVVLTGTTPMFMLGGTTSSFPAWKQSGASMLARLADDSADAKIIGGSIQANNQFQLNSMFAQNTSVASPTSCGTSPAVTVSNGSMVFVVTGGTGGTATGCTIAMPTAPTGWNCNIVNITAAAAHRAGVWTVQTASTTTSVTWEYQTVSTGAATAFTASDVFRGTCFAY